MTTTAKASAPIMPICWNCGGINMEIREWGSDKGLQCQDCSATALSNERVHTEAAKKPSKGRKTSPTPRAKRRKAGS